MKKTSIISILTIIIIYIVLSFLINKTYILPSIGDVLLSLKNIVFDSNFLIIIFTTLWRCVLGLIISFVLALIFALLSYFHEKVKDFIRPIYILLKTIPNITYIIVSLLWLGRNGSVILVSSLVVFPILYNSILNALTNIDISLIEVTDLYEASNIFKARKVYLPLIKNDLLTALANSCSLGLKVSIMAEILSQVRSGIGKELYFAKANFLMADIFAWTIIIVLISVLIDYLLSLLKK